MCVPIVVRPESIRKYERYLALAKANVPRVSNRNNKKHMDTKLKLDLQGKCPNVVKISFYKQVCIIHTSCFSTFITYEANWPAKSVHEKVTATT